MLRALELAPGNADVLIAAGAMAYNLGRLDEAIAFYRQTVVQDPLRASGYQNLGMAFDASDRLTEAEAAYRKALELAPKREGTRACLAVNVLAQGRGAEAPGEAASEPEEVFRLWALAIIKYAAGRQTQADTELKELIAKYQTDSAYQVAVVYGFRGEAERAFDWLERAYVQRDPGLSTMKSDPLLRSLHADPRWNAFLCKMGLAD